jgi:hypothetical protein
MGVLARVAGSCPRGTDMSNQIQRRQQWRSLSSQDKHQRLQAMRQQQQRQVQFEMLRLQSHTR